MSCSSSCGMSMPTMSGGGKKTIATKTKQGGSKSPDSGVLATGGKRVKKMVGKKEKKPVKK